MACFREFCPAASPPSRSPPFFSPRHPHLVKGPRPCRPPQHPSLFAMSYPPGRHLALFSLDAQNPTTPHLLLQCSHSGPSYLHRSWIQDPPFSGGRSDLRCESDHCALVRGLPTTSPLLEWNPKSAPCPLSLAGLCLCFHAVWKALPAEILAFLLTSLGFLPKCCLTRRLPDHSICLCLLPELCPSPCLSLGRALSPSAWWVVTCLLSPPPAGTDTH